VSRPAELLGAQFETDRLARNIAKQVTEESDAGALPLLSYLLADMWTEMVRRGDGVLRLSADAINVVVPGPSCSTMPVPEITPP